MLYLYFKIYRLVRPAVPTAKSFLILIFIVRKYVFAAFFFAGLARRDHFQFILYLRIVFIDPCWHWISPAPHTPISSNLHSLLHIPAEKIEI